MAQDFYTREQAAQVLQISPEQLDQMRTNGQIAGQQEGGAWKFSATQVNAIAANRTSVFDSHQGMPGEFGSEAGALPSSEYGSSEMGSSMGSEMGSSEAGSSEMGSSEFTTDGSRPDSSSEFDLGPIGDTAPPAKSSSNDFDMLPQQPAGGGTIDASSEFDVGSDIDIGSTPGTPSPTSGPTTAKKQPSILKLAPDVSSRPPNEDSLEFDLPPTPSVVGIGSKPPAGAGSSRVSAAKAPADPQSEVRLDQLSGSFEFSPAVDSSSRRLAEAGGPATGPKSEKPPSGPKLDAPTEDDSDVRLDFDPGAAPPDDELIGIGDKPDSDVRIDPVSEIRSRGAGGIVPPSGGQDLMETEEIDLGAELQQAAEASLAKRPRTPAPSVVKTKGLGPASGAGGKTVIPDAPRPTMLPETSPFELTSDDIGDAGSSLGASGGGSALGTSGSGMGDSALGVSGLGTTGGASEFELTLAPEDEAPKTSPLNLGDDEDIDLGAAPGGKKGDSASNRAELSGINLQVPADSGVLLSGKKKKSGPGSGVKAGDDESVDFELTLDEDVSGPKTLRGKLTDSDSEFELTLDESGSSKSLPKVDSGDQKDIFETDFDLQGAGGQEESGSQAVALSDEPDTDLESSDFDLALEDDQSAGSESLSEVGALDESTSDDSVPKGRTKVLTDDSSLSASSDDMSLADDLSDQSLLDTAAEEEPAPEEEEAAPMSVPAAQADWGLYPLIMMIPCVVVMLMASLMAYELVHSMYGFHQTSKPSGLLVESFANMFKSDEAQPAAPGAPKMQ